MSGEFPKTFMQPRPHIPFKNPPGTGDDPRGDLTSGEVQRMNQDYRDDERLRVAGHNE